MNIVNYIAPISDTSALITKLLNEEFHINIDTSKYLAEEQVKPHFDKLKDTCYLLAETQYVDKVYRNSFYNYFSSKLNYYKRDCIRISIFECNIDETVFRESNGLNRLRENYRGFIVLRPTEPFIIGRSVISPKALKHNTFLCCSTNIHTSVNGVKFEVEGFPHSSQDTETISCAETSLWAIMEYFSNKYPEYKPVLPSKIISTLNNLTVERQLPSRGLNIEQMSFALREFGFGTRLYSREEYANDFEKLLSCYVESGIPVILGIDNHPDGDIGHAMLCIGHDVLTNAQIDKIPSNQFNHKRFELTIAGKNILIFDYDDAIKEFVFVDDNLPVYQKAMLSNPTNHYKSIEWKKCRIRNFLVPLYHKIYLEAYEAKNFIYTFLLKGPEPLSDNTEVLIRFYLSSSRSFRDYLALNNTLQSDFKDLVLELPMPKFIWVAEISNKELIKTQMANGLILLDATEANLHFNKPLILAAYQGKWIKFDALQGEIENIALSLPSFRIYSNNLRNI